MPAFDEWESFYVIVGAAAGALIGLQFVVMTLVAERPPVRVEATVAFAKPTIIHFSAAFFLSALMRVPWQSITPAAALWGLVGFSGVAYAMIVIRRIVRQSAYQPDLEDWIFHAVLPLAGYGMLALSAFVAPVHPEEMLFVVGAAVLLLLFIAVHNAWDAVVYQALRKPDDRPIS